MSTGPAIRIFWRNVYGRMVAYPAPEDDNARLFSDLVRGTTFTRNQLRTIEQLGYEIIQVADPAVAEKTG